MSPGTARKLHANALLVQVLSGSVLARETVYDFWKKPSEWETHLPAGKALDMDDGSFTIQPFPPASVDCAWAWEQGELCLYDQPLPEALEEINRYTAHQVVMADPSLAEYRVGGPL